MIIVGCDFHPSWEQVAWLDSETGETCEQKLVHGEGEAERFYRQLPAPALIGLEATGNCHWLQDRLAEMGHEVGDAAQIRASYVRKQKTDKRDAAHLLQLLVEGRFPRLWVPDREQRDLRQLLIHRQKLVEIRTRVKNGLQHLALNQGVQKKSRLWSRAGLEVLRALPLAPWAFQLCSRSAILRERNRNSFHLMGSRFHLMGSPFSLNRTPFSFQTFTHISVLTREIVPHEHPLVLPHVMHRWQEPLLTMSEPQMWHTGPSPSWTNSPSDSTMPLPFEGDAG